MQLCHERNVGQELLREPKEEGNSKDDVDDYFPICKLLKKPLASRLQASVKINMKGAITSRAVLVLFEEPVDAGREMEDNDDDDVPSHLQIN